MRVRIGDSISRVDLSKKKSTSVGEKKVIPVRKNPPGSSRRELKVLFGAGVGDVDVRYVCVPVVVPKAGGHFDADWRDRPRSLSQEGPRPRARCPASSPTNRPTRSGATPPARLFQRVLWRVVVMTRCGALPGSRGQSARARRTCARALAPAQGHLLGLRQWPPAAPSSEGAARRK